MTLFDWIESIQTLFEVQTHEGYIWFNLYISSCWIESYMMLYYSGGVTELWQTQKNTKKLELWVGRLFIHRIHCGRIQCHSTTRLVAVRHSERMFPQWGGCHSMVRGCTVRHIGHQTHKHSWRQGVNEGCGGLAPYLEASRIK